MKNGMAATLNPRRIASASGRQQKTGAAAMASMLMPGKLIAIDADGLWRRNRKCGRNILAAQWSCRYLFLSSSDIDARQRRQSNA